MNQLAKNNAAVAVAVADKQATKDPNIHVYCQLIANNLVTLKDIIF
jgi:hypothetical protein